MKIVLNIDFFQSFSIPYIHHTIIIHMLSPQQYIQVNYKIMILEISSSWQRPPSKKLTWKQQLRRNIFKKNKALLQKKSSVHHPDDKQLHSAQRSLMKLIEKQSVTVKDEFQPSNCHSYYSSYIPLQVQSAFDDELSVTFPFIKHKTDSGRLNDRTIIVMDISEAMSRSRAKGDLDATWQRCLDKYLCGIDSIRAAELYLQFKKYGTQRLGELHKIYGGSCTREVFYWRVSGAAASFRKVSPVIKTSPFSVQAHEEINEVTMPKTMKQLFCCICFTYDCNQHSLEDLLKEKDYQYLSPKNLTPQEENVRRAIGICISYAQLLEGGRITGEPCSEGCFRRLSKKQWNNLQLNRVKLLSPLVKGVVKLGIEMYSYNPCAISVLLTDQNLTCSHVFLYMVQEHGIMGRLQRKLLDSQSQLLTRERQIEERNLPQPVRRGKKRIRVAHTEHNTTISTCAHYFRGDTPLDQQCESCSCRQRQYCLPQCMCSDNCPIRKRGCGCKKLDCRTDKCTCFSSGAECDPLICSSCFGEDVKKICRNHPILSREFKRVRVGRSTISEAGLGLFAGEIVRKDELLMIYSGELIDHSIDILREGLSIDNSFYNFGSPQGTIDARFMGNASRFINHGNNGEENLFSKNVLTEGRIKVAFYATRDIDQGEELFFDYDGQGILFKNYKQKYPFIKNKKK